MIPNLAQLEHLAPELLEDLREWLGDRAAVERKDPYLCSAIANGTKPS